jgi:hypothetical protein
MKVSSPALPLPALGWSEPIRMADPAATFPQTLRRMGGKGSTVPAPGTSVLPDCVKHVGDLPATFRARESGADRRSDN